MSEKELIDSCQKGHLDNFGQLYEKYIDEIFKFIFLKTYDKELSEDLTSQTFFKALDKINSFKNEKDSNFRAWLYRIAYNLVIDNYKNKKENIELSEILENGYSTDLGQEIDNKEKIKEVLKYFDTLKESHKQILIMRIWDDLSYKEISEITGESVDNCKKIVSRNLAKLPGMEILAVLLILILKI